jgi:nucleolar protein 4
MGAASVVYTSVKAACQAVAAIHGKTIGGGIVWARQQGGEVCALKNDQWFKIRLLFFSDI